MPPKKSEPTYESAMKELEEIVRKLESTELPLDDSLSLFEKGIALSKVCSKKLSEAEKKIDQLLRELSSETKNADAPEA
jgi:exodeoxyribonuclease VII small subunit